MKKLALALVCLVSVAFFASCDPQVQNPEPTIAVLVEEGYVANGDVVDLNTEFNYGFVMAANTQTNKELASLIIKIDDNEPDTIALQGTEYTHRGTLKYELTSKDEIVGESLITAIVTDAAGETATASIKLSINQPALPLIARTFEWYRLGNTQTGLDQFGLYWERNAKVTHAQIKPLDGVTMYTFASNVWDATTTDVEKAALFSDGATEISVYDNVSTTAGGNYDDVIGTKMANGTLYLIHVTKCVIDDYQSAGYPIHITGEAK